MEVKANELRIGNIIEREYDSEYPNENLILRVEEITYESLIPDYYYINGYAIDLWKPIPLTEEWLIKLGAIEIIDKYGRHFELGKHWIYIFDDGIEFEFYIQSINQRFNLFKKFKHVHVFQNLIFALTGTELTIKGQETI